MPRNKKRSIHKDPLQDSSSSSEGDETVPVHTGPLPTEEVGPTALAEVVEPRSESEHDGSKTPTSEGEEEEASDSDDNGGMQTPSAPTPVVTPPQTPRATTPPVTPPPQPSSADLPGGSIDLRSPVGGLQVVKTRDEANALVKHLKRLEQENNQFSLSLTNICNENARLTDRLAEVQEQLGSLSMQPLQGTSVLQALFDKDQHAGWLSGGKSATKEKLQHTLDDLQNEFIAYRQSHMTTNDEVHALVQELQSAHTHSAKLAGMVREMQKQQAKGAATIRVVVEDAPKPNAPLEDVVPMRVVQDERHATAMRVASLENDLRKAQSDFAALVREQQLTNKIVEREQEEAARDKKALASETSKRTTVEQQLAEANKRLSHLKAEHEELVATNAQLEEELSTISNRMAVREEMQRQLLLETTQQRDSETNNLTMRVLDLETQLADARGSYDQEHAKRKAEAAAFEAQLEEMRSHLEDQARAAKASATESAESSVMALTSQMHTLEQRLTEKQTEYHELMSRLSEERVRHEEEDAAWTAKWKASEATVAALRRQIDEAHIDQEEAHRQHDQELSQLQKRLVEAQESIANYESELGKTVSLQNFLMMEAKCQRLEDEVALLQEQKGAAEAAATTLRGTTSELEAKLAESARAVKSKDAEIAALSAKASSLGALVETLDASRSDDVSAMRAAHEKQLADLHTQHDQELSQLQKRLVEAQESIANYESELGKTVSLQNFLMMETKCQRLEDEVALLQEQKASVEASLSSKLNVREKELSTAVSAKIEELSVAKQRNELLLKRCAGLTQEKNALEHRLAEDSTTVNELRPQVDALSEANRALQSRYDALESAHSELETKMSDLNDAFNATERRSSQTIALVERDKATLDDEKAQLEGAVATLQAAKDRQAEDVRRLEGEVGALTSDKDALTQELVRAREAMSQMDLINTKSQLTLEQMGSLGAEKERLQDEVERQRVRAADDQRSIETLKEQLEGAHRTNDALQLEVHDLQSAVKTVVMEMETNRTAHAEALAALGTEHKAELENAKLEAAAASAPAASASRGVTLEGELRIHQQMIEDLEAQVEVLTSELDAVRRSSAEQERQFAQEMTTMMEAVAAERNELERKHNEELSSAIAAAAVSAAGSRRSQSREAAPNAGNSGNGGGTAYDDLHQKYQEALQNKVKNEAAFGKRITALEAQLATTVRESEERIKERTKSYETELEQCRRHIASLAAASAGNSGKEVVTSDTTQPRRIESVSAAKQSAAQPADDSVSAAAYYAIKCDNDRLHEEIKRQASKFKEKEADYQVLLQRAGVGNKGTAAGRSPTSRSPTSTLPSSSPADDANENGMVVALRTANATLLAEKEALLQQLGAAQRAQQHMGAPSPTSLYAADDTKRAFDALEAKNETMTMQIVELKRQLEERKALNTAAATSFHAALDASERDVAALKEELTSLKHQHEQVASTDGHENDTSGTARRTKPKGKTGGHGGRKKSLLGAAPAADDILLSALPAAGTTSGSGPSAEDMLRLEKLVEERSKELDRRTAEVSTLKSKVQELMTELRTAQKDVEELQAQHEEELHALREELRNAKEVRLDGTASVVAASPPAIVVAPRAAKEDLSHTAPVTTDAVAAAAAKRDDESQRMGKAIADGNRKIVELQDTIATQRKHIESLESHLRSAEAKATAAEESCKTLLATTTALQKQEEARAAEVASRPRVTAPSSRSPTPLQVDSVLPDGVEELKNRIRLLEEQSRKRDTADAELMRETQTSAMEMDKRMRIKNKEVEETKRVIVRLTGELLPLKQKLAEYAAFADRAGVSYPLPEGLEGTQMVRLQSVMRGAGIVATTATVRATATPANGAQSMVQEDTPVRRPTATTADPSPVAPPRPRDRATRTRTLPRV